MEVNSFLDYSWIDKFTKTEILTQPNNLEI